MLFSIRERESIVASLRDQHFDLLVVGGGITGAGVARDAALRGLRVALIDRDDFASGTSSRSSKLIHGGLRYLEQGDVGLVFEAVRERQRLLKLAPHLAISQSFVVPVFPGARHGVLMLDLGLTIYDTLAAFSGVLRHRAFRRTALLAREPILQPSVLGGVRYYDAQTNDVRLVVANLRGAHHAGASVVSRVQFDAPLREGDDGGLGKVVGARLTDLTDGRSFDVRCSVVVLAAGPFADDARARWLGRTPERAMIRPSKGVHIVVPRARLPLSEAIVMTARDERIVFALPWTHVSVIGTTDTPYDGDLRHPRTSRRDAEYLLDTANRTLVARGGPLTCDDVIATWAGIRPLAIGTRDDATGTYQTSREHIIESDPTGMVLIAGGKLTTYRVMAEQGVDAAIALLPASRVAATLPSVTVELPLPGAEGLPTGSAPLDRMASILIRERGTAEGLANHLVYTYGSDAIAILDLADSSEDGSRHILPGLPTRWAEVDWVLRHEMPLDLVDLAVRRLPLYYIAGERVLDVAEALAERMRAFAGWDAARAAEMVDALAAHVADGRLADDAP